jgi:hypothetical protein
VKPSRKEDMAPPLAQSQPQLRSGDFYAGTLRGLEGATSAQHSGRSRADSEETRSNPTETSDAPLSPWRPDSPEYDVEDRCAYEDDDQREGGELAITFTGRSHVVV